MAYLFDIVLYVAKLQAGRQAFEKDEAALLDWEGVS